MTFPLRPEIIVNKLLKLSFYYDERKDISRNQYIEEECCNQMENLLFIAPYNKTRRNDGRKSIVCSRERYVATVIVRWESYSIFSSRLSLRL